jgi:hypothetical protein
MKNYHGWKTRSSGTFGYLNAKTTFEFEMNDERWYSQVSNKGPAPESRAGNWKRWEIYLSGEEIIDENISRFSKDFHSGFDSYFCVGGRSTSRGNGQ